MHSTLQILDDSSGPELISLADLKAALGIAGATEDAALQAMITFQSRIIAEYCDRRLALAEASETFTLDRGEVLPSRLSLQLSLYPVAEILEVTSAGATVAGYEFDPATGRLWSAGCWSGTVSVVYSGGYDLPDEAPSRLQMAVVMAVNEGRTSGTRDPSIREVQHGDTRISYFTSETSSASAGFLSASVVDLIKPYRRMHVA